MIEKMPIKHNNLVKSFLEFNKKCKKIIIGMIAFFGLTTYSGIKDFIQDTIAQDILICITIV